MAMTSLEQAKQTIHLLLEAQGEIHPGWNDEYILATWVRSIATEALQFLEEVDKD